MRYSSFKSILAYKLGIAGFLYWLKGNKIKRSHPSVNSKNTFKKNIIIAVTDEFGQNGGLCDCLHGIISSYYIAKLTNNEFRISFTNPFLLSDYLNPNLIDWKADKDSIDFGTSRVRCIPMMLGRFHATWVEERLFHQKYMVQQAKKPGAKVFYTNAHLLGENEFSQLFNELFCPSQQLQEQVDLHLSYIGGEYMGASFRFRNLLGDFFESDSSPELPSVQEKLVLRCIEQLELLHKENPTKKIFVASDSSKFCSSLLSKSYIYTIPGQRGHTSTQGAASAMSSFLDLLLLSKSIGNRLYLAAGMYRSSFAQTASFIGNLPYKEVFF